MVTAQLPRDGHVVRRIVVRCTLMLDTPTSLGNGDADGPTDMPLLRDSASGGALLTGASIAGALRAYLHERANGFGVPDIREAADDPATLLFGGVRGDDEGEQSPLIINDAVGEAPWPLIERRDGVKIEGETSTAKNKAKYDIEVLAAGTTFPLLFELAITDDADEAGLINALATVLSGLEGASRAVSIGMKKRRGFGRCRVKDWSVWQFDLRDPVALVAWLTFSPDSSVPHAHTPLIIQALASALGAADVDIIRDRRCTLHINAVFYPDGPLLIRSEPDAPARHTDAGQEELSKRAADVVQLHSYRPDEELPAPVVPGTSIAGVLRHRAERIVAALGKDRAIVEGIFGFVEERPSGTDSQDDSIPEAADEGEGWAQASRLIVHESVIAGPRAELVQNRVAIDRFTGGAYHGALFAEQILYGSTDTRLVLELELREPRRHEIGLLLLLLKDLWTGDLVIGGEGGIGRGRLKGVQADIGLSDPTAVPSERAWRIAQAERRLVVDRPEELDGYVTDLVEGEREATL